MDINIAYEIGKLKKGIEMIFFFFLKSYPQIENIKMLLYLNISLMVIITHYLLSYNFFLNNL